MNDPKEVMDINVACHDWSGTISDDARPVYQTNMHMLIVRGKEAMNFEEWKRRSQASIREFMSNHGIDENPEKLFAEYTDLYGNYSRLHPPKIFPDARETLEYLKSLNITNIIISTHPKTKLLNEIRSYDIIDHIDEVYGSVKSKAQTLREVAKKIGVLPLNILYGGDTVFDVLEAHQAGVNSYAVATGYHHKDRLKEVKPTLGVLEKLSDLKLFRLNHYSMGF